jgi:transcriptional regulator with XRE-family HTH domain
MRKSNSVKEVIKDIEKNSELLSKWRRHYDMEKAIIEKIVEIRKLKGISQKDLADITGLKQSAIARIEKRINSPQLDTIIKIADALDLKFEFLSQQQRVIENNVFETYSMDFNQIIDVINETISIINFKIQNQNDSKEKNHENQKYDAPSRPNFFA